MPSKGTWNPLRSEQEAFQFLIAAMAYFGAIVLASVFGGVWAGVSVFGVLTVCSVAWFLNKNRRLEPPEPVGSRATPADEHRVLVVANETVAGRKLHEAVRRATGGRREAKGEVGDADPLQAIADSLRTFGADEIIISTHPPGRSNWLEKGVVSGAKQRFTVPITHVVVDLEAEAAQAAP